jgi:GTPase SAR1 family protein
MSFPPSTSHQVRQKTSLFFCWRLRNRHYSAKLSHLNFLHCVVHDVLGMDREFGGEKIHVGLWDTRVREDNDRLRVLSYPQTDLFIICFDVSVMRMFQNVTSIWAPEVSNSGEGAPCVLIGCKSDLRNDVTTVRLVFRGK